MHVVIKEHVYITSYVDDEGESNIFAAAAFQSETGWPGIAGTDSEFVRGRGYYLRTTESGWFKVTADRAIFVWEQGA